MDDLKYPTQCDEIYEAIKLTDFIVVHGMGSTGKTTLVKHILTGYNENIRKEIVYSYVNCNTVSTTVQFFNLIVDSFKTNLQKGLHLMNKTIMGSRDFIDIMVNLIEQAKKLRYRVVVAVDSVEYLKKTPALDCLYVMVNIRGLKLMIVTCDSASCTIDDYFKYNSTRASLGIRMKHIEVPCWSKEDIIDNICKIEPTRSRDMYKKFVNNVVQIFYASSTRDFVELRTFCMENFEKFLEQYEKELKEYVEKYEPELLDDSMEEMVKLGPRHEKRSITSFLQTFKSMIRNKDLQEMTHLKIDRKIVFGTSILIIAAFIAANTKPSDDKRNFLKYQKRKDRNFKDRTEDDTMTSAKHFTMERLIQIYRALSYISQEKFDDENSEPEPIPDSVLSDIKMLEDLKIITIVSGDGFDTFTKYTLSKDLDRGYFERLAKQVRINLEDFHGL